MKSLKGFILAEAMMAKKDLHHAPTLYSAIEDKKKISWDKKTEKKSGVGELSWINPNDKNKFKELADKMASDADWLSFLKLNGRYRPIFKTEDGTELVWSQLAKNKTIAPTSTSGKAPDGAQWERILCTAYNMKNGDLERAAATAKAGIDKDKWKDHWVKGGWLSKGHKIIKNTSGLTGFPMKHYGSDTVTLTTKWSEYFTDIGLKVHSSTKTPKTDMILGGMRISLKKKGGSQLMSGGKGETLATLGFAWEKVASKDIEKELKEGWDSITDDVKNNFYDNAENLPAGMTTTDLMKGKGGKKHEKLHTKIKASMENNKEMTAKITKIFNKNTDIKYEVVKEAMTGNSKFVTDDAKSTHMMIFDPNRKTGEIKEIDTTLVNKYTSTTNFNISFKSSGTGGKTWIGLKGIFKEEVVDTTELDNIIEWAINDTNQEILQEGVGSWMRSGVQKLKSVAAKTKDFVIKWIQRIMKKIWGKIKKLITSSISALQNLLGVKMVVRNNPQITF
jgi:hypothetical protein